MLMASRLIYGMAQQDVLPRSLGKVLPGRRSPWTAIVFTTLLALGLIAVVTSAGRHSGGRRAVRHHRRCCCWRSSPSSTSPAWCCAATRRREAPSGAPDLARRSSAPCAAPTCSGPGRATEADTIQYKIAGGLLALGVVLWALTWLTNRGVRAKKTGFRDIEHLEDEPAAERAARSGSPPAVGVGATAPTRVPLTGEHHPRPRAAARPRRGPAADVPRPGGGRRGRRAAAHRAAARLRGRVRRAEGQDRRGHPRRGVPPRRAATAPRRSTASPPTTSATSCGCCSRWPSC